VNVFLGSKPISTASGLTRGGAQAAGSPAIRSRRMDHGARLQSVRGRRGPGPYPCHNGAMAESWKHASPMGLPLVLAALLVTVALLLAPERPEAQEAICKRHAGVEACRVW